MRHPSVDGSEVGSRDFRARKMVERGFFVSASHWAGVQVAVLEEHGPGLSVLPVM